MCLWGRAIGHLPEGEMGKQEEGRETPEDSTLSRMSLTRILMVSTNASKPMSPGTLGRIHPVVLGCRTHMESPAHPLSAAPDCLQKATTPCLQASEGFLFTSYIQAQE